MAAIPHEARLGLVETILRISMRPTNDYSSWLQYIACTV